MGDHEHACLRNGTQQPHHHMVRGLLVEWRSRPLVCTIPKGVCAFVTCLWRWRVGVTPIIIFSLFSGEECEGALPEMEGAAVEAIPKQLGVERAVMCQPPFGGSGITAQPRLLPVVVSTRTHRAR